MRKLAICYPGDFHSVFAGCVESLLAIEHPADTEVKWFRGVGWCQARRRNHAAEQALEWGADLICTLDFDQVYEPDILKRLVARYEDGYEIVAAMVPMRGYVEPSGVQPFQRLAWKLVDEEFTPVDPEDGEIQECEFPTSAALLFSAEALQRLKKPWYFFTYKPETWEIVNGEDATFALRMTKELGIKAWVDTTIRVKHAHVFEIDETYPRRFADWTEKGVGDPRICRYED